MVTSTLGNICNVVMGQSPPGETCNICGIGLPLLNGPTEYGQHHPTPVQFTTDARKRAQRSDVLFCVRGSTTGRMNWADREYAIGRGVAAIRHKQSVKLQPLVRAVIEYGLPSLLLQATGSTFPNVSADQLKNLWWPTLSNDDELAIAHILGTLDDKIELNRQMNETLEAMAQALFKAWFVDFEPVRAKAKRRGADLPKEIADLFPDSFEDSELGEVPKGWKAVTLGDIAKNVSITFDFTQTKEVIFVNTGDVLEGDFLHSTISSHVGLPGQAKKSIRPDDILFSEIRPANKRYAYVDFDSSKYVVSTKFMIIRASEDIHPRLLYRILIQPETLTEFQIQAESRSGTFPQITFDSISYLPIVLPQMKVQEAFQRAVRDIDARIKVNKEESRTLAAQRDTLLPKLLSGAVRVKNLDSFTGRND